MRTAILAGLVIFSLTATSPDIIFIFVSPSSPPFSCSSLLRKHFAYTQHTRTMEILKGEFEYSLTHFSEHLHQPLPLTEHEYSRHKQSILWPLILMNSSINRALRIKLPVDYAPQLLPLLIPLAHSISTYVERRSYDERKATYGRYLESSASIGCIKNYLPQKIWMYIKKHIVENHFPSSKHTAFSRIHQDIQYNSSSCLDLYNTLIQYIDQLGKRENP